MNPSRRLRAIPDQGHCRAGWSSSRRGCRAADSGVCPAAGPSPAVIRSGFGGGGAGSALRRFGPRGRRGRAPSHDQRTRQPGQESVMDRPPPRHPSGTMRRVRQSLPALGHALLLGCTAYVHVDTTSATSATSATADATADASTTATTEPTTTATTAPRPGRRTADRAIRASPASRPSRSPEPAPRPTPGPRSGATAPISALDQARAITHSPACDLARPVARRRCMCTSAARLTCRRSSGRRGGRSGPRRRRAATSPATPV